MQTCGVCACVCLGMCACLGVCACVNACACVCAAAWRLVPDRCRRAGFPLATASSSAHAIPLPLLPAPAGTRRGACRHARPCPSGARPGPRPFLPSPRRRRRAPPSSGSGRAGASPGARSPAALALVLPPHPPPPATRGSPGRERAAGRAGAVEPGSRRGFRLARSLLCLARSFARSLAQRRQQRSRTDAG